LRPVAVVGRDVHDRAPAGPVEGDAEGVPGARRQLPVPLRGVHPGTGLQRRVGQPADTTDGRRGEERAARVDTCRPRLSAAAAEPAQTTARTARARAVRRRCRAARVVRRRTAAPADTGTATATISARVTTAAVRPEPIESLSTPTAGPMLPQSEIGLKGRSM